MSPTPSPAGRLGVAIVGLGGAVATTTVAGLELMRQGLAGTEGLPLASLPPHLTDALAGYDDLVFGGWDFFDDDLAAAVEEHAVLDVRQREAVDDTLRAITPWPAVGNERFCRKVTGANQHLTDTHEAAVAAIQDDLTRFADEHDLDRVVVVNLASTEASVDPALPVLATEEAFREGLAANHEAISPAMLYAYAAIDQGRPFVNFTPSLAADVPALTAMATRRNVPVAGKDGKTGQTFLKTLLAPGLRTRALKVDGWYSTNILGNRDGLALSDGDSLDSKLQTKGSVLDQILGYRVEDHVVTIDYYRPRGDNKEAWDNVDLVGFLGQKMQLKINFLCRDSILAAPLVVDLVRLVDLADRRGDGGVQEALSVFFKSPMMPTPDATPEHALPAQQRLLLDWLAEGTATGDGAPGGDGAPARGDVTASETEDEATEA
jgi:myo-inositol-1-phosphate synthase